MSNKHDFSAEVYVPCNKMGEHVVQVDGTYTIENDGIGWYEFWGHWEYDGGSDAAAFDDIDTAYLVRCGFCKRREDAPRCAKKIEEIKKENGEVYYRWEHHRKVNGVVNKIYKATEELFLDGDFVNELI